MGRQQNMEPLECTKYDKRFCKNASYTQCALFGANKFLRQFILYTYIHIDQVF